VVCAAFARGARVHIGGVTEETGWEGRGGGGVECIVRKRAREFNLPGREAALSSPRERVPAISLTGSRRYLVRI